MRKALLLMCLFGAIVWAQEAKKPDAPQPPQTPSAPPAAIAQIPPQAVVVSEMFDAGDVVKGIKVEHAFVIRNTGKGELEILSAKPG